MARVHIITDATTGQQTTVPFSAQEEAAADAAETASNAEAARQATFTGDATRADILNRLKTATASQIRTYVTNNVTDLASTQRMIANILILVALDTRN